MTSWVGHLWSFRSMGKSSSKTALQELFERAYFMHRTTSSARTNSLLHLFLLALYLLHVLVVLADFRFYLEQEWGRVLQSCLIPNFGGNGLSFSPFRMMSDVGFLYIAFIMLS